MALGTIKGQSEDAEDDRGYRAGLYHLLGPLHHCPNSSPFGINMPQRNISI